MAKIFITGAGSAQSNGVINCLLKEGDKNEVIGLGSDKYDLMLSKAHKRYLMPHSTKPEYKEKLLSLLNKEKPDMIHFQHDKELFMALKFREEIEATGVRMLVPDYETIDTCVHKYKSWQKFKDYGIKVPENIVINNQEDLKKAFETLGNKDGTIWLRAMSIGGGGKGALPTNDFEMAVDWINNSEGWGDFVAAELLTPKTVTWLAIFKDGELVVAQGRKRGSWAHAALSPSGVTGVTRVGETYSDPLVDEIGLKACKAVSKIPHGIYGVDMAYDENGIPNPTEINISRFFTTVQFFAEAGLNMPVILKDVCVYNKFPELKNKCNPLPDGLLWLRGMDVDPMLTTEEEINKQLIKV
ncbi:MAG: carbamoyl phosphate synthase-like protein [Alphaproteobacteria bacterium ADurb.Bin438]|nr:MAG: carbamoyl phosphate synthase-like protein [Alphaproteobacteria bacterium ADurb.Bin438]